MLGQVELKVGNYSVLDSGSVMVYDNEPLEFCLDDGDGPLTVRCVFEEIEDVETGRLLEGESSDNESTWRFVNFNSRLGIGSRKPVEVGVYNERKLYLKYFISTPK